MNGRSSLLGAGLLGLAILGAVPARAGKATTPPPAEDGLLPLSLAWCATREEVDAKVADAVELAEGLLDLPGDLDGQRGRFNLVLESGRLKQVRFRTFDTDTGYATIEKRLTRKWGASFVEEGLPTWKEADSTRIRVKRQSGDIFVIYSPDPSVQCPGEAAAGPEGPTDAEKAGLDKRPVFDYDPYADDPLEDDSRGQEVEAQRKAREEEERRKAEEEKQDRKVDIQWGSEGEDSTEPKDPSK
ncbi:hypothetical protein L6R50_00035 [Myxococcota bacterium]|nr:hypothetical protein [Myxococcota bacterium]